MTSSRRSDIGAAGLAVFVGVLVFILPHLLAWRSTGSSTWIADNDELELYLAVGSHAYRDHPFTLEDPVAPGTPSIYPWLQLGPGVLLARCLGTGPLSLGLVWRTIGGATIALGWYLLGRRFTNRPGVACVVAILLTSDPGLLLGRPLLEEFAIGARLATGRAAELLATLPRLHTELRIMTPGLSLGFLLVYLWLVARSRQRPSRPAVALAGLALGLQFYVYFYSWTAALLGLVLTALLDRTSRRLDVLTALIGCVTGGPALLLGERMRRSANVDWLQRSDKFLRIPRTSELLIPKIALASLVVTFVWLRRRRPELLPLWTLAAAGLVLENHQVVTGLQIENFHWCYVWGPALSATIVLLATAELERVDRPRLLWALAALTSIHLVVALVLRGIEATATRQPTDNQRRHRFYEEQRRKVRRDIAAGSVIAGDIPFVDLSIISEGMRPLSGYAVVMSSAVDDEEWDARVALDAKLRALDHASFATEQRAVVDAIVWGPWARDPKQRENKLRHRLAEFDSIADVTSACRRFAVRYVALPTGAPVPPYASSDWLRLEDGPTWQLWERPATKAIR